MDVFSRGGLLLLHAGGNLLCHFSTDGGATFPVALEMSSLRKSLFRKESPGDVRRCVLSQARRANAAERDEPEQPPFRGVQRIDICVSFPTRISVVSTPVWTMESGLRSRGPYTNIVRAQRSSQSLDTSLDHSVSKYSSWGRPDEEPAPRPRRRRRRPDARQAASEVITSAVAAQAPPTRRRRLL